MINENLWINFYMEKQVESLKKQQIIDYLSNMIIDLQTENVKLKKELEQKEELNKKLFNKIKIIHTENLKKNLK